ncbi:MAG: nickel-responsive transcriptional regulator NikR [Burkholderiaceae bacterium]|nr:nickel-responsive transcriptional regulator NikR [Burkholderiaceae bacterium]
MQRFTISLDDGLAQQFDDWIARRGYENRSEAVRDLLRAELQQHPPGDAAQPQCVASLSYVYDHQARDLAERMAQIQHRHHDIVVATLHVQLDHHHRLETVTLRGATPRVTAFADSVCAERGVHHGKLNLVSVLVHQPHQHGDGPGHAPHVHLKPAV